MIRFVKLFGVLILMSSPILVSAQFQVGAGGAYTFEGKAPGIFARVGYDFTPQFSFQGDFTYYFLPSSFNDALSQAFAGTGYTIGVSAFDYNINALYYFKEDKSGFSPYALAGLNIFNERISITGNSTSGNPFANGAANTASQTGFNVGVGAAFPFGDSYSGFVEVKEAFNNLKLIANAGIMFKFGGNDSGSSKTKKRR